MNGVLILGSKIFDIVGQWIVGKINNDQAADELEKASAEAVRELRGLRSEIASDRVRLDAEIATRAGTPT